MSWLLTRGRFPFLAALRGSTVWTGPAWTPDHVLRASLWTAYGVIGPRLKERRYTAFGGERFRRCCQLVPRWLPGRRPLDVQMLNHTGKP